MQRGNAIGTYRLVVARDLLSKPFVKEWKDQLIDVVAEKITDI